jgi:hypothetical protein
MSPGSMTAISPPTLNGSTTRHRSEKAVVIVDSDGHGEMFPLGNANGSGEVNKAIFTFLDQYADGER